MPHPWGIGRFIPHMLELPKAAADDSGHLPLPHRLQDAYRRRIAKLPAPARTALLVAAAEESGALAATLRAMAGLGLTAGALAAAEGEGLITVEAQKIRSTTRRRGRSRPASGPAGR
ncbi:hypothetical protein SAMN05444920_103540 [Nonomuraea solani]|uniref:Uncharacterized protein n=1 Tax=Nonomuraea solani TaxID=1144553 RepID=A0A1H6BPY4_9ACTN|nr:hypothetical protein [Nonomuraea solani]SEG62505.1 hypothetical protein SAMN05444920_103540 [Nonomuraea solani]